MAKIHSRRKRTYNLSTHLNQYRFFHPVKKHRPKTFKTEEAANAWALSHGLTQGQYCLKKVKRNRKFQIIILKDKILLSQYHQAKLEV